MLRKIVGIMLLLTLVISTSLFVSCSDKDDFYLGNGASKDEIRDSVLKDDEKWQDQSSGDLSTDAVYFTKSGTVWHTRRDCSYLKSASEIIEGTLDDAVSSGKERACTLCTAYENDGANNADQEQSDPDPDKGDIQGGADIPSDTTTSGDTETEGEVFWLVGGSVWHKSKECSYIHDDSDVCHGSVSEAMADGMLRLCSRCEKNYPDQSKEDDAQDEPSATEGGEHETKTPGDFDYVYVTEQGTRWHADPECRGLSGSDSVRKIYFFETKAYGKNTPCSICAVE